MNKYRRLALGIAVAMLVTLPAVAFAAAPSNDNFANAAVIPPGGGTVTGSNVDATAEPGEPDHADSTFGALHSVWYSWTAPADGLTTIDTCGSGFNTRVAVYVGGPTFESLAPIASNDDASASSCGQSLYAALSFQAGGGQTVYIAVDTSGGVPDNTAPPQGTVSLTLDGPDAPDGEGGDEKTNPGTPVPVERHTVRVPRFIASCGSKTPKGNAHCAEGPYQFKQTGALWEFFNELEKKGIPTLADNAAAKASTSARTPGEAQALRNGGFGGELMNVNIDLVNADGSDRDLIQGKKYRMRTDQTLTLDYTYFYPAKDKQAIAEEKAALERKAKRNDDEKEAKSRCLPIAAGKSAKQIQDEYFPTWKNSFYTFNDAIAVLSKLKCDVVAEKFVRGKPSAPHAYVKDVLRTNEKDHTVFVSLAQPGNHDFVFTVRENPAEFASLASRANIPFGTDGNLTVSKKQMNRLTVQVIERATGKLVAGIPVTFVGKKGEPVVQTTDGNGETTFVSSITEERDYRLSAVFQEMEGWLTIKAVDRRDSAFTSMSGRRIVRSTKDLYAGNSEAELDFAKALPVVPAMLGSGDMKAATGIPRIQQSTVTTVAPSGALATGQHNVVSVPKNSSMLIGAAPGLLAIGGGDAAQAARPNARAGIPNPLAFLANIVSPLKAAYDSGVANIRAALSAANQAAIAATANLIGQAGGNLISDKGLGVISVGGGNLIGQAGGNLISDKGLGVIAVGGGNLIGQAGGNLISDKGLGVIANDGCSCTPVHGGRVIATGGGN